MGAHRHETSSTDTSYSPVKTNSPRGSAASPAVLEHTISANAAVATGGKHPGHCRRAGRITLIAPALALLLGLFLCLLLRQTPASRRGRRVVGLQEQKHTLGPVRLALLRQPGICLGVEASPLHNGRRLELSSCDGGWGAGNAAEFLLPENLSVGTVRWAKHPAMCFDAPGNGELQLWDCITVPPQNSHFAFSLDPHGQGSIISAARPSQCMAVLGREAVQGAHVGMLGCSLVPDGFAKFEVKGLAFGCKWQDWSDWSSCTTTCGGGIASRSRHAGLGCFRRDSGADSDTVSCGIAPCPPVDCVWGDWADWSRCSRSCDTGRMRRVREIICQPEHGGMPCQGSRSGLSICATDSCPGSSSNNTHRSSGASSSRSSSREDCVWGEWEPWSLCSATCGGGKQVRVREVVEQIPGQCPGPSSMWGECSFSDCPPKDQDALRGVRASVRIAWAKQPHKCLQVERIEMRGGQRLQLRHCGLDSDSFLIPKGRGTGPIRWAQHPSLCFDAPGGSQLQLWNCSHAPDKNKLFILNDGEEFAIRWKAHPDMCLDVPNGRSEDGTFLQLWRCGQPGSSRLANMQFLVATVPTDCEWGPWSEWSPCTKTCSIGTQSRTREVVAWQAFGGSPCVGNSAQPQLCGEGDCTFILDPAEERIERLSVL